MSCAPKNQLDEAHTPVSLTRIIASDSSRSCPKVSHAELFETACSTTLVFVQSTHALRISAHALDDYKAAQRLHIHCNQRVRFWFPFWHRFMPVVSSAALVLLVWDIAYRNFAMPAWVGGLLAGLSFVGLYVLAIRPLLVRRRFRSFMEDISGGDGPVQLELREGN